MANEASILIVARMRDEASKNMEGLGKTVEKTSFQTQNLTMALTASGSALVAVGSLMGKMESPTAKMASNFMLTAGAIMTTASAIIQMLPKLIQLINMLRNLVVVQSILQSLVSPLGLLKVGAALAVGVGAYAATTAAMGGFSSQRTTQVNISGATIITDESSVNQLARKITEAQRIAEARGR